MNPWNSEKSNKQERFSQTLSPETKAAMLELTREVIEHHNKKESK